MNVSAEDYSLFLAGSSLSSSLFVRAGSGRGWKRVLVWRITVPVDSHNAAQRKGRTEGNENKDQYSG